MNITDLQKLPFSEILGHIDSLYTHTPTAFKNGELQNAASENQGSAKIFYFAKINNLSKNDTLLLFAEHYQAVLDDLQGTSHQNIRNFMKFGTEGLIFENAALHLK